MKDARIVLRDVGALQVLIGAVMLAPLLVSLIYGEIYSALAFLASGLLTACCGAVVHRVFRDTADPERRHAMMIAALGWLAAAAFGSLPFIFAAWWTPFDVAQAFVPPGQTYLSSLAFFKNPLHAFFESMSAYTTTGLTMAVHEPSIGKGLLFYRSLAQWVGGAGVVVLALAVIPRPQAVGVLELYQSESAGIKIMPSILSTARAIWKVYATLTAAVAAYLLAGTLLLAPEHGFEPALFDSINHAMTGLATGGFSTLDDSIAGFESRAMEILHLPPMILGAISLPLYYTFLRERRLRVFARDPQFSFMMGVFAVLIPLLALLLWADPMIADPFREGLFQVISGVSGTGWQTSEIGDWTAPAVLLLAGGGMVVSGSAGSTVGGIKLIRAYLLFKAVMWRLRGIFLPGGAVVPFKVGERLLSSDSMNHEVADAAVFSLLYLTILAGAVLMSAHLVGHGFTLADVIFECVSAQSTVGLSTGITHPGMEPIVELLFILQMWVGRLEIFPVIILLGALFTKKGRS